MTLAWLCAAADIAEGAARGFEDAAADPLRIVLARRGGRLFAYRNACPHLGTPLNLLPDRFLDRNGEYLLCRTHGAIFRVEDGLCLAGPCRGARLDPIAVAERDGLVVVFGADASEANEEPRHRRLPAPK